MLFQVKGASERAVKILNARTSFAFSTREYIEMEPQYDKLMKYLQGVGANVSTQTLSSIVVVSPEKSE